jgi:NTP pyrophosphatase (non-canonical NTP hydrolase)
MEKENIYIEAIKVFGKEVQLLKAVEEMAELTQAIVKLRINKNDYSKERLTSSVIEELADVIIMVNQLSLMFDRNELGNKINAKLTRLKKIIQEAKDGIY